MSLFHKNEKKDVKELMIHRLKEKTNQKIIYFHLAEEKSRYF